MKLLGALNFFNKKESFAIRRDEDLFKIREAFFDAIEDQNILTSTIKVLMSMADKQEFIYMWLKDAEDRYIFANKNTRETLFNNRHISKIINRTDSEIITGKKVCSLMEKEIINISPEQLPTIMKYMEKETLICNLTDIITRCFNKPCKFVEVINDFVWVVWKDPLFKDGNYNGNVGYAIDVTNQREEIYQAIEAKVITKEAFRIDSTESYYFSDYSFPELRLRSFI